MVDEIVNELEQDANELENQDSMIFDDIVSFLSNLFSRKEAAFKTEGGTKFHAGDYAYVPDATKPSTWKLRLAETPGKVTVAQLGRAAAAFSAGGFRGNRVQLPSGAVASAKRKIRAAYARMSVKPDEIPESVKESGAFMIWKEASGQYRWLATYSNAFRDDDFPPEIISKASHQRFVNLVDTKQTPMPELWHWHVKDTKYGIADWVAFDEDSGFAMAMGYILPGHEKEAEALSEMDGIGVSHGMPTASIKRDEKDNSIINEHITVEISDLPMFAAANKLTDFTLFKESDNMTIPDVKKEYLRKVGLTDEKIAEIDEKNKSLSESAIEAGIETKGSDEKIETKTEEKEVEVPVAETKETPVFVTKQEVASTLAEVLKELTDNLSKFNESVTNLSVRMDKLEKSSEEKSNELSATPTASLAAMIARNLSAIGSKDTQVRKDSPLAKDGPLEFVQKKESNGTDFMSDIIQNIISGKK